MLDFGPALVQISGLAGFRGRRRGAACILGGALSCFVQILLHLKRLVTDRKGSAG